MLVGRGALAHADKQPFPVALSHLSPAGCTLTPIAAGAPVSAGPGLAAPVGRSGKRGAPVWGGAPIAHVCAQRPGRNRGQPGCLAGVAVWMVLVRARDGPLEGGDLVDQLGEARGGTSGGARGVGGGQREPSVLVSVGAGDVAAARAVAQGAVGAALELVGRPGRAVAMRMFGEDGRLACSAPSRRRGSARAERGGPRAVPAGSGSLGTAEDAPRGSWPVRLSGDGGVCGRAPRGQRAGPFNRACSTAIAVRRFRNCASPGGSGTRPRAECRARGSSRCWPSR
jgi:hypothetical protein